MEIKKKPIDLLNLCKKEKIFTKNNNVKKNHPFLKYLKEELDKIYPNIIFKIQMAYLKNSLNSENYKCPVCSRPRMVSNGKVALTCGKKDKEHLSFINKNRIKSMKQTNFKKYGMWCNQVDKIKKKKEKTYLKKYGVKNISMSNDCKEKVYKTNLERYGNWYNATNEGKEKIKEGHFKKYGNWYNATNEGKQEKTNRYLASFFKSDSLDIPSAKEFIENEFLENEYLQRFKMANFFNCTPNTTVYKIAQRFGVHYRRIHGQSSYEYRLIDFIKELIPSAEIIHGSKQIIKPYELDIYLPEYNLAIEFNGYLFHTAGFSKWSAANKTPKEIKGKHLNKYNMCKKKGIDLIQIPEFYYNLNKDFWFELIALKLKVKNPNSSKRAIAILEPTLREGWWDIHWGLPPEDFKGQIIDGCIQLPEIACPLNTDGSKGAQLVLENNSKIKNHRYYLI